MYKIIFLGDRNWSDHLLEEKMRNLLLQMPKDSEGKWLVQIIHGGCRGVDKTTDKIAKELGFTVQEFPANRNKYGRAAGPIRNIEMLKQGVQGVYFPLWVRILRNQKELKI